MRLAFAFLDFRTQELLDEVLKRFCCPCPEFLIGKDLEQKYNKGMHGLVP